MRYWDEVAIITDARTVEYANALRGALESFHLRVRFHRIVQRTQVLEALGGELPLPEYTVLVIHGHTEGNTPLLRFEVVDNPSPDPRAVEGWFPTHVDLTPDTIPTLVKMTGGTVLTIACEGGREPLAQAFLAAGCDAYVGCETAPDMDSATLFCIGLFYFLLSEDRDNAPRGYTLEEAVKRAAALDSGWAYGTRNFHCYQRREAPSPPTE